MTEKDTRYQTSGKVHKGLKKTGASIAKSDHWIQQNEQLMQRHKDSFASKFEYTEEEILSNPKLEGVREDVEKYGINSSSIVYSVGKKKRWEKFGTKDEDEIEKGIIHLKDAPIKPAQNRPLNWDNTFGNNITPAIKAKENTLKQKQKQNDNDISLKEEQEQKMTKKQRKKKKYNQNNNNEEDNEEEGGEWTIVRTRKGKKAINKNKNNKNNNNKNNNNNNRNNGDETKKPIYLTVEPTNTYAKKAHRRVNSLEAWEKESRIKTKKKALANELNLKQYFN